MNVKTPLRRGRSGPGALTGPPHDADENNGDEGASACLLSSEERGVEVTSVEFYQTMGRKPSSSSLSKTSPPPSPAKSSLSRPSRDGTAMGGVRTFFGAGGKSYGTKGEAAGRHRAFSSESGGSGSASGSSCGGRHIVKSLHYFLSPGTKKKDQWKRSNLQDGALSNDENDAAAAAPPPPSGFSSLTSPTGLLASGKKLVRGISAGRLHLQQQQQQQNDGILQQQQQQHDNVTSTRPTHYFTPDDSISAGGCSATVGSDDTVRVSNRVPPSSRRWKAPSSSSPIPCLLQQQQQQQQHRRNDTGTTTMAVAGAPDMEDFGDDSPYKSSGNAGKNAGGTGKKEFSRLRNTGRKLKRIVSLTLPRNDGPQSSSADYPTGENRAVTVTANGATNHRIRSAPASSGARSGIVMDDADPFRRMSPDASSVDQRRRLFSDGPPDTQQMGAGRKRLGSEGGTRMKRTGGGGFGGDDEGHLFRRFGITSWKQQQQQQPPPSCTSSTAVQSLFPPRETIDDAIRGRLDGIDIISLGPARSITQKSTSAATTSSSLSGNRRKSRANTPLSTVGAAIGSAGTAPPPQSTTITTNPQLYTARQMIIDMLRVSGGRVPPEMVLEGFHPTGEDRWIVRFEKETDKNNVGGEKTKGGVAATKKKTTLTARTTKPEQQNEIIPLKRVHNVSSRKGTLTREKARLGEEGTKPSKEEKKFSQEAILDKLKSEIGKRKQQDLWGDGVGPIDHPLPQLQPTDEEDDDSFSDHHSPLTTPGNSKNNNRNSGNTRQAAKEGAGKDGSTTRLDQIWGKDSSPPYSLIRSGRDGGGGDDGSASEAADETGNVLSLAAACSVPVDIDEDMFIIEDGRHLQSVHDIASMPLKRGRFDEALDVFDKIVRSLKATPQGESNYLVGSALHNAGIIKMWAGRFEEALFTLREALRIRIDCLPIEDHPDVAVSLVKTGIALFALERFDEALSSFERGLQIAEAENTTRAKILNNIGATYFLKGDLTEALKAFTSALEIHRVWLDAPVRREALVFDASITLGNMGKVYLENGNYNMSLNVIEESLLLQTTSFKKDHNIVLTTLGSLAFVKAKKGDTAKALQIYKGILKSQVKQHGLDSREAVETTGLMSVLYIQQCDYDDALKCLTGVLKWQKKNLEPSHPAIRNTKNTIKKIEQALNGEVSVWI